MTCGKFLKTVFIRFLLNLILVVIIAEHGEGYHHDHTHDSTVSSVSIVYEGTLDLDEVINVIVF